MKSSMTFVNIALATGSNVKACISLTLIAPKRVESCVEAGAGVSVMGIVVGVSVGRVIVAVGGAEVDVGAADAGCVPQAERRMEVMMSKTNRKSFMFLKRCLSENIILSSLREGEADEAIPFNVLEIASGEKQCPRDDE